MIKNSILLSLLMIFGFGLKAQEDSSLVVNKVYEKVDQKAQFNGGIDAFSTFINDNIVYPEKSKRKGITGVIHVSFIVEKDATVSKVKSVTEVTKRNGELADEAIRVIESTSGKWIPAMLNGEDVRSYCVIAITFELE